MASQQAVIYSRVSSREQSEGYSIEAQVKLLREAARKQNLDIIKEFVEVESAKTTGRKVFNEMVTFFENNRTCRTLLVEKTDRLYRNIHDPVTVDDLDIEVHFVKEGDIISKSAKSQVKFVHDIRIAVARNYSENLREEVKKGMNEKASQGFYPGRAPFGYRNNKDTRKIDLNPEKAAVVKRAFELYASGRFSLKTLAKEIRKEKGVSISRSQLGKMLTDTFYIGRFDWAGKKYEGKHERLVDDQLFAEVQSILHGLNRGKYGTVEIPFRGVLRCRYCGCMITGERKKGIYVYYRCTCGKGDCQLRRFTEREVAECCGQLLKGLEIPNDVAEGIVAALESEQEESLKRIEDERSRIERSLVVIRHRQDQAFVAKLDGEIPEDLWQRNQAQWQSEELRLKAQLSALQDGQIDDRILDVRRTLELAQKAYSLYVTRKPEEQAELIKTVLLNCSVDNVSLYPTYRKPFDLIIQRAENDEWWTRLDSNQRPLPCQPTSQNVTD
jgi:site-specific DNA recombinase